MSRKILVIIFAVLSLYGCRRDSPQQFYVGTNTTVSLYPNKIREMDCLGYYVIDIKTSDVGKIIAVDFSALKIIDVSNGFHNWLKDCSSSGSMLVLDKLNNALRIETLSAPPKPCVEIPLKGELDKAFDYAISRNGKYCAVVYEKGIKLTVVAKSVTGSQAIYDYTMPAGYHYLDIDFQEDIPVLLIGVAGKGTRSIIHFDGSHPEVKNLLFPDDNNYSGIICGATDYFLCSCDAGNWPAPGGRIYSVSGETSMDIPGESAHNLWSIAGGSGCVFYLEFRGMADTVIYAFNSQSRRKTRVIRINTLPYATGYMGN